MAFRNSQQEGPAQAQAQAQAPLQDFPPLGASSPPEHGTWRGNGHSSQNSMNGGLNSMNTMSAEYRPNPTTSGKAIPAGPHQNAPASSSRTFGTGGAFNGPRSPPNAKNTSHVPCKFFKIGQCQAGNACPFSHSTDASKFEQPCKYFSKGNCKFGQKCALLHILPNGRLINKPHLNVRDLNIGGRVDPTLFQNQESARGNSLLTQQVGGMPQPFSHQIPHVPEHDQGPSVAPRSQPYDIPQTRPGLGTPKEEMYQAMSPLPHFTTLDAPLPASFDSQGISYMARHGPVAASMPGKIGVESPPSSLPKNSALTSEAIRGMADAAYANANKGFNLGSSPLGPSGDIMSQRIMHSSRFTRPKMMSASLPRQLEKGWEDDQVLFGNEEEWIPGGLSELMTPEERNRRSSGKVENPMAIRESLTGNHTSADVSTRIGSPGHASPLRYSPWNKPKTDDEHSGYPSPSFGPVGSPLRNATLYPGSSPSLRASRGTSDLAFKISSPPRQSATSVLSQQLQRTRLTSRASESSEASSCGLHPTRHISNPRSAFDRAVSSSSVTNERIDEEQPEMVFSLDDEDYGSGSNTKSGANIWGPAGIARRSSGRRSGADRKDANGTRENDATK